MSWPGHNQAMPWNPGMAMQDMNSGSYTPEQWAMMQQQNWQQWTQWQQQYSQWQNHYGDKYAQQLQAVPNIGGIPPPPPSGAVPPPPPDKPPPPPPHENNQPLFNSNKDKPSPAPNLPPQRNNSNYNANPGTGNDQWSYSTDTQQPAVNAEALRKLAEEEKLFDIQFEKWEEEIDKWRQENVNHPDKQAYKDYEEKFEACRTQLLERRKQMKIKRAALLNNPVQGSSSTGNTSVAPPPPIAANQINYSQNPQMQNNTQKPTYERQNDQNQQIQKNITQKTTYERQNDQKQQTQKNLQNNSYERQFNSNNRNNIIIEPQHRYETYQQNSSESNDFSTHGNHAPHGNKLDDSIFLPSTSGKGIPGLDLVPDSHPEKKQEVIDITDDQSESQPRKAPDYSTISMGINNILGDEKIMNILSMVRGIKPPQGAETGNATQNALNTDSQQLHPTNQGNRNLNMNQSQQYGQRPGQFQPDQDMNSQYQPPQGGNYNRHDSMQKDQHFDQKFGGHNSSPNMRGGPPGMPHGPGGPGGPRGPGPSGPPRPMQQGGPGLRHGGPGIRPGGPGMQQGGPGMQQGGPGMQQGGPGMQQGMPRMQQGGPGMQQGMPRMQQGGPGMQQGGHQCMPGMRPGMQQGPGIRQNMQHGGQNMQQGGPDMQHGGPNMQQGGPNMQQGGPNMQQSGQNFKQGGPNMHQSGPNMHQGGPNMQHGAPHMQQGGSNMQPGGPRMQQGGPNMHQGGPHMQQGGPNMQQGGSHMQQGGPNMNQGGLNVQQGGPNKQHPQPLMANRVATPSHPNNAPGRPPLQEVSSQNNTDYYGGPQVPIVPPQPPKPKWVEDPLFTPSIVVEYEHKSLRLKARDFIEPVHTFDYNHKSKDDENKKKDFEYEVEDLFTRKPRRSERDFAEDRFRDHENRNVYSRDYERRGIRDDFRDMPRDIREIRGEVRDVRGPRDSRDSRDIRDIRDEPREIREPRDFRDIRETRDFRERDSRSRDDIPPRDRLRDGPREDLERRRDDRHEERRRDDLDRHGNRRVVHEDTRDRERDYRRDGRRDERDSRRNDFRDVRRDDNRIRSTSRDKDSRKRAISRESEVSNNSKKSKDAKDFPQNKHIVMIDDLLEPPGRDMRPDKIVIIMRGLPGSGKSYLAKLIRDREAEHGGTSRIMSIDDYFMQESEIEEVDPITGKTIKKPSLKYEYDASLEETYINSLKRAFKRSLTDGYFSFLIYDAVNTTLQNYADIWNYARQNGFQVYICTMEQDVTSCFKRNIHNRKLEDLEVMAARFFPTPAHHIQLDATTLLQNAAITDVQMEDVDDVVMDDEQSQQEVESVFTSKWEKMDDAAKLARLDGTSKPLRPSQLSMEDYLQLDDWTPNTAKPGKKTVRWADLEERRQQEKMRAIGFVVGQTDWNRMTDPTMGSSALTQTKYIERVKRN